MQLNDDALGKTLTFETVLGAVHRNLVFTDNLSAATASSLGQDVAAKHQQYRSSLPAGTPDDYRGYRYAKFEDASGEEYYFGIPWIKAASIVVNANPGKRFTFPILTAAEELSIRAMLTANGIEGFTVETI